MRKKIVAGNWKMNLVQHEAISLVSDIVKLLKSDSIRYVEIILAPPFVFTPFIVKQVADERLISIAAQNCSDKAHGAYTGEISAAMLQSVGVSSVLIGHSERRNRYHENDTLLAEKVKQVLSNKLTVTYCCGEMLAQREDKTHFKIIEDQLKGGVFHLSEAEFKNVVIAYEPVWAIGTGVTASSAQAQEMHQYIRKLIAANYDEIVANNTSILYGGSCNEKNAAELFALPDVDGGLIGGAALKAESFVSIIKSFS